MTPVADPGEEPVGGSPWGGGGGGGAPPPPPGPPYLWTKLRLKVPKKIF